MRIVSAFIVLVFSAEIFAATGVQGKVGSTLGCSDKVMMWVSLDKENYQERLLLLHTEVPVGGTFQFNLLPGHYQLRGSDEKGCDFFQKLTIGPSFQRVFVRMTNR